MFQSAAVFCGSKPGSDPLFSQHAAALGALLAQHKITLVYGGGNTGLMGTVANAALENEGNVIGVMPKSLVEREFKHDRLTQLHIVEDMHTRKKMMYSLCDAAIILPGGYGTLDEVIEMMAWNSLSIHDKKVILLNSAGFYDPFVQQISIMKEKGFLYGDPAHAFTVVDTPEAIFNGWLS
ncbi:TIGR00730 family Rossman fold protein [Chitinophaga filiformis]|uniref:Cytokinin riboside 5'-monophosphate phosphoribohydrolase n=1 Tax=Chitinophaga filiformis TaxID=104663 RepID=A0ABY4HVP9_CHIFI|nr:TIGR00730 family Rossman fold protein [Chitinophaga filiformis]UPK67485.1 TIGR00730 family Rossman fold protein [Chitinophaga filiformis]